MKKRLYHLLLLPLFLFTLILLFAALQSCGKDDADEPDSGDKTEITAKDFDGSWRCFDGEHAIELTFTDGSSFTRTQWDPREADPQHVTVSGEFKWTPSLRQLSLYYTDADGNDRIENFKADLQSALLILTSGEDLRLEFHRMQSGPAEM